MDPVEEQAQKMAGVLAELKRARDDQGGKLDNLQQAIDAMKGQMTAVQQAQDAMNRASVERAASGTDAELDLYIARSQPPAQTADHYLRSDSGQVCLTGHYEKRMGPDGASYDLWRPGLLDDPSPKTKAQLRLQRAIERRSLALNVMRGNKKFTPQLDEEVRDAARACGGVVAKIFADSSGIGAAWAPGNTVPELEREILIPTGLAAIFPRRPINAASIKLPKLSGRVRFHISRVPTGNDPAADPLSNLTDSETEITTVSSAGGVQFHRDWSEDEIIGALDEIRMALIEGHRWAEDDKIMNGDTAATHQDAIASWDPRGMLGGTTGLGTVIDHRRSWLGLRARAIDLQAVTSKGATDRNAAQTWDGMRAGLSNLGAGNMMQAYFGNTGSVCSITSWEYFFSKLIDFDEFASWDKVGALAAVLTGQVGDVNRTPGGMLPGQVGFVSGMIPVIVAGAMTADLAATGLYTGSGTTTGMIHVDRSRFEYVIRKSVVVEQEVDIRNNTSTLVARGRSNFRALDAVGAGIQDLHYDYNLTF